MLSSVLFSALFGLAELMLFPLVFGFLLGVRGWLKGRERDVKTRERERIRKRSKMWKRL